MSDEQPVLAVRSLAYAYRRTQALKDLSFSVMPRSIHGFVGPNGAGKTTTLKILATLLKPRYGRALVFGHDIVRDYKAVRRRIGFMPDALGLYTQMTVFECLDFFGAAYGMRPRDRDRVIGDLLALTDMTGRRDDTISSLSRGMVQRLSLARALVHDPDLLLLDEPASGLDPRARIELMEILKELSRMGKTIFISSHILSELAGLCDSVTIIDRGVDLYSGRMDGLPSGSDGQTVFAVRLETEAPAVGEALRAVPGVLEVTRAEDRPVYTVKCDGEDGDSGLVLRAVLDAGGRVAEFKHATMELADLFMQLTQPGVPS